jgi:SUZ domain
MPSPPDTTSSKDRSKWTREEKEAHYKAARERIFRDFQEAHGSENSTVDTSANMSRSSSSSGRKKCHKHKAPRDDSFEARSSYVPGFPGISYPSQNQYAGPNDASGYHQSYGAQTPNPMLAMAFGSNATQLYSQYDPTATFRGMPFLGPYPNDYGTNDGWPNLQSPQPGDYYNFARQPTPAYPSYGSAMSPSINPCPQMAPPAFQSPNQEWAQPQYHQPYQAPQPLQAPMGHNGAPRSWQGYPLHPNVPNPGGPYQFGQTQFQQYPSTPPPPNNQHPLPGSYNRPAFNPQTRSFVPGGPNIRFGAQGGQGRTMSSPFAAQGLHNSQNAEKLDGGARASSAPNKPQESLQKKWGTPAHLPNKPPPSQVPSTFEIENTAPLPSQQSFLPPASSIAKASPSLGNN